MEKHMEEGKLQRIIATKKKRIEEWEAWTEVKNCLHEDKARHAEKKF